MLGAFCVGIFEQSWSRVYPRIQNRELFVCQCSKVMAITGSKCQFWLPKKKRYCAVTPLPNSSFCGNHTARSDGCWIPCPIDPSHSVLEENLQTHIKRCPLLKHNQSLSRLPFYSKGINAGCDSISPAPALDSDINSVSSDVTTSEMKRRAVNSMTVSEFRHLITKIKSVHASICKNIPQSYKIPDACGVWINGEVDRKLPFQEKHVLQQASILGNLEELGVLKPSNGSSDEEQPYCKSSAKDHNGAPAVVEFGAGRGYLTQMLADCYWISKIFLVERKSYKLKADRSLRQKESMLLERLRIDIEDLNIKAIESLQGLPYLAIGKHLCGPATDMTLRCCLGEQFVKEYVDECKVSCYLRGLAIATCCHHLCQWKHYINKNFMVNLGIDKEDFHAITWFTSWAVDADHGSDLFDVSVCSEVEEEEDKEKGIGDEDREGEEEISKRCNMSGEERGLVGLMCKDIIDVGRLMWIKQHGGLLEESQLVKYVPSSISPENRLLVAASASLSNNNNVNNNNNKISTN